jgi:predicted nucleotidyltransferase
MGNVYSPEQIARGQVPVLGAHEEAGQYILHELFEPLMPPEGEGRLFELDGHGVDAAMVYGSTAYGTTNIRSDLDILVFFRPSQATTALSHIGETLQSASKRFKVSVESNVLPVGAIHTNSEHGLDPLFTKHLIEIHQTYNGRWCRNNPTDGLDRIAQYANDPRVVSAEAHRYAAGRRNFFVRALTEVPEQTNCHALQRALEFPSAIGRKAVAALASEDAAPLDMSSRPSMNARARAELFANVPEGDEAMVAHHDRLYTLDQEYTAVLKDTVAGETTLESYKDWINGIAPEALQTAFTLSQTWVDILRAHRSQIADQAVPLSVTSQDINHIIAMGEDSRVDSHS